jgi:hypothetical protein
MTTVAPWHSTKENHYHNNDRCGPGGEIPQHNREAGTGNKPLCKDCKRLNDAQVEHVTTVAPWHSKKENHYHNNHRCGPGGEIPQHNREAGTGNKPLCQNCKKLNDEGK